MTDFTPLGRNRYRCNTCQKELWSERDKQEHVCLSNGEWIMGVVLTIGALALIWWFAGDAIMTLWKWRQEVHSK